jgi:hypothetical protein
MEHIQPPVGETEVKVSQLTGLDITLPEKVPEVSNDALTTEPLGADSEGIEFIDGYPVIKTGTKHLQRWFIVI